MESDAEVFCCDSDFFQCPDGMRLRKGEDDERMTEDVLIFYVWHSSYFANDENILFRTRTKMDTKQGGQRQ